MFMNTENSMTNEPHRFGLSLADKLNLTDPNKNITLDNLSIYYTWKNIKSTYNNKSLKFLLQIEIMNSVFLMDLILLQTSKTTFEFIIKNMKL